MKRKAFCLIGFLVFIYSLLYAGELYSAPYYQGKIIRIVVWAAPGGGNDINARLVARHIPKHIPGKPTIIVENMPGANGLLAVNDVYNKEKPDGLTIGTVGMGLAFSQLLKAKGVKFDLRKFSWIGTTGLEASMLATRTDLPYKNINDLLKAEKAIYIGSAGPSDASTQFSVILKAFTSLNLKFVTYQGGSDIALALERKEVDGRAGTYSTLKPYIDRGLLRPLVRGRAFVPEIENLPVNENLTSDKTGKAIMAMHSSANLIGRPFVCPPGTPANILNILRNAFDEMTNDPAFKGESKKYMMDGKYVTADECMKVLNDLFNQPEDILREFKRYVNF